MQPSYMTPFQNTYHPGAYAGAGGCGCNGSALGAATGKGGAYNLKNFILTPQYLVGFAIGFMVAGYFADEIIAVHTL